MFPLCSILWIRLTRQYITELPHRESTFISGSGIAKLGGVLDVLIFLSTHDRTRRLKYGMASGSCSVERRAMAFEPMHCSTCHGVAVVKYGKTSADKQRFRCQNPACKGVTFIHN